MLSREEKIRAFESVRIIIYLVMIGNGLLIQYVLPFHYLCDLQNYSCAMCGMRHAVNYMLRFQFTDAYRANHYIVGLVIMLCLMICDMIHILYKRIVVKKSCKKQGKTNTCI